MAFQLVQIIFWLALSTWFGSVIFLALAAPIIFRTIREANPVLTDVLSVNLQGQHATLLAGTTVGNLLSRFAIIELGCAGAVFVMALAQFFTADLTGRNFLVAILRCLLCLIAGAIVAFDRVVLWPRIVRSRDEYIQHADEPEIANPARERFDAEQRRSMTLMMIRAALLLLLIMYSANVQSAPSRVPEIATGK